MPRDDAVDVRDKMIEAIVTSECFEGYGIETYEGAGVLTMNTGLILTDEEGRKYQIEILGSW